MSIENTWFEDWGALRDDVVKQKPRFFEATTERAASVLKLRPSWRIEDLLGSQREDVLAWFQDLEGRHRTAPVSPVAARELYRGGMTLYLKKLSWLEPISRQVAASLSIPAAQVETALFCNRTHTHTCMHFDPVGTITIQLRGRKRWHIAANKHAPSPTVPWAVGDEVPASLRTFAHDAFPTTMPTNATSFDLEPGACLYVPPGYWHATESHEESVSLHVHLVSMTWADAVLATLRGVLMRDEVWRRIAFGLWHLDATATPDAATMLSELRAAVATLSVEDLTSGVTQPSTVSATSRIVRRARSTVGIEREESGTYFVRFSADEHGTQRVSTVEMSAEYVAATLHLARARYPVSPADLADHVPGLTVDEAVDFGRVVLDVGFARVAAS